MQVSTICVINIILVYYVSCCYCYCWCSPQLNQTIRLCYKMLSINILKSKKLHSFIELPFYNNLRGEACETLWKWKWFTSNSRSKEKHLCWSLFLIKLQPWRSKHRWFPVNFAIFLRAPFFIEHLRWLLL